MAAYGIVRFFPKLGAIMSRLLVITYIFPPILLAIPYSIAIAKVGLTNSLIGLMIVYLSFSVPYAVWLLVGFFQTVPIGIEEAAKIDGANKWQQIAHVTLPSLVPMISIMLLLSVGGMMHSDTGLFYQVTRDSGTLYSTTQVLDSYVLNAIFKNANYGFTAAATFFQSVVGTAMILLANGIVRKIAPEDALF